MPFVKLIWCWTMAQITITINSRDYAVACDDGQERYMLQLARILDEKARQLTSGGAQINENMLLAMVGLLVADELTEMQKKLDAWQKALPSSESEITDVDKGSENADLRLIDEELAEVLNKVTTQIKMLANEIESI